MAEQYRVMHGLLNCAILVYLEGPRTKISRSGHSLMLLNICEMAKDTVIVTMEGE